MSTDAIEQIEGKIAHLEKANADLSDVVYRQQQELDALRAQFLALIARLDASTTAQTEYTLEQEKPPHY